jgi:hypothetical protein
MKMKKWMVRTRVTLTRVYLVDAEDKTTAIDTSLLGYSEIVHEEDDNEEIVSVDEFKCADSPAIAKAEGQ